MSTWMILASGAKADDLARDPVVEAGAEGDEQVGLLHRRDGGVVAVHAGHAQAQRVGVGEGAPGHQGGDHVDAGELGQLPQGLGRPGLEDAAAGVDDRPAGLADEPGRLPDHLGVALGGGLVAGQVDRVGPVPLHGRVGVAGGRRCPWGCRPAPGPGRPVVAMWNASRMTRGMSWADVISSLCLVTDRVMPDGVALLEGVGADGRRRHLAGDDHDRDRVHHGVAQGRDDVGGRPARWSPWPRPAGRWRGRSPRPCGPRPARGARGCGGWASR